jgi:hypothetical protein
MIDVIQRQDVTILRMAHGKANALDVELCQGITERLERLRTSPSVAVVLIGKENIFSAGVDLLRVLDEGVEYLMRRMPACWSEDYSPSPTALRCKRRSPHRTMTTNFPSAKLGLASGERLRRLRLAQRRHHFPGEQVHTCHRSLAWDARE